MEAASPKKNESSAAEMSYLLNPEDILARSRIMMMQQDSLKALKGR